MIARLTLLRFGAAVLLAAALAATLLLFAAASRGDGAITLTVNTLEDETGVGSCEPEEDCMLREAIIAVNEAEEGAEYKIVFTVEGTIDLADELRLHPSEDEVEVAIKGPGAEKLTLDVGGEGRVFNAREVVMHMSGLTITGGEESGLIDGGGGILVVDAGAKLSEVRVTGNVIGDYVEGGGIAVENGATLELVDSVVDHNVSESEMGGGVYVEAGSNAEIQGSTIEANEAEEDAGGGIAAEQGGISIVGSTIRDNRSAEGGGGVWIGEPAAGVEIISSLIEGNHSDTDGGGVKSESPFILTGSTVAANSAGDQGGGLYVEEETEIKRSTVAGNEGGGVVGAGGSVAIRNSTVVGNSTPQGGPGAGVTGSDVSVVSSILSGNLRDGGPSDCEGTIESEGFNLLGSEAGCGWTGTTGDRVGEDPLLAPLGDHGGPTPTMPPESRLSPAINHGSDPEATDQRGFWRPIPSGDSNTDIGAVEVQAPSLQTEVAVAPAADLEAGETLTCTNGTWDVDTVDDPSFAFAWIAEPEGAREQVGSGETLLLSAALAGREIVCEVSADNGAVAVAAESEAVELAPAHVEVSPTSLYLGEQRVGTTGAGQTIVLTASGGVPLEVTAVESTNPAFAVDGSDCTAAPVSHSTCEIEVSFTPPARGEAIGAIEIESNGGDPSVPLGGIGLEAVFHVAPTALSFPQTEVGAESAAQGVVVTSQGNEPLEIASVQVQGANAGDFRIESDSCATASLEEGEHCAVSIVLAPSAAGPRGAQLVFAGNEGGSVELSGSAVAPGLLATPAALQFGSQPVGGGPTAPSALVLSNPGSAPTRIESIAIEGPDAADFGFAANECIGGELAPGAECLLRLTFDPSAAGARSAQLVVAGELNVTVPLGGSGSEPAPPAPRLRFQRGKGPLTVNEDGIVHLRLACVSAAGACRAGVKLLRGQGAGAGVSAQLASKRVSVGAGDSRPVALRLGKAARRALAERGRLPAVLAIEATAGSSRANLVLHQGSRAGGNSGG